MRDIQKMCRICLGAGSREIFENSTLANMMARDDLSLDRIAEKLRFITMLKISPKENLPQQICDLCIVQLNVSYNFKRLALKNDFHMRNYMIENGMSLTKEDENEMQTTTALEIHQIQHNVIRTNTYRPIAAPELRRNSTTSSVSGTSTMIINGANSDAAPPRSADSFVTPRPAMVRPIQIKTEPVDPDEEPQRNESSPTTSSPSTSTSEPNSIVTVSSSVATKTPPTKAPMVQINGLINNDSFAKSPPKKSPGRPAKTASDDAKKAKPVSRDLRTIKKKSEDIQKTQKLKKAIKQVAKRSSSRKVQKDDLVKPRAAKTKVVNKPKEAKKAKKPVAKPKQVTKPPRGRPPKLPQKGQQKNSSKNSHVSGRKKS